MKTSLWHVKRITAGTHHPSEHFGLPLHTAKGCQFSSHNMIMQDTVQLRRSPASAQLRPLISLIWKTQLVLHVLPNPLRQLCGQPAQDWVCAPVNILGICGLVGRATACGALCRGFDPCRRRPRGVTVDFGPKQSGSSGRLINHCNQLGKPSFITLMMMLYIFKF